MVQPINYMLDVVNPMTAALSGYSTGVTERTNQQVTQQNMELAAAQEARAAEAFQLEKAAMEEQRRANQAAVAQAAEAKRRGEAAMGNLIDLGSSATAKDYMIAIQENPALASSITEMKDMLGSERVAGETKFGTQLFAALNKNPGFAKTLLEERRIAAEAAGDQRTVDTMKSYEMMMEQPDGPAMVLALTGTALAGIMDKDQFEIMTNTLGLGGGKEFPDDVAAVDVLKVEVALELPFRFEGVDQIDPVITVHDDVVLPVLVGVGHVADQFPDTGDGFLPGKLPGTDFRKDRLQGVSGDGDDLGKPVPLAFFHPVEERFHVMLGDGKEGPDGEAGQKNDKKQWLQKKHQTFVVFA